MAEKKVSKITCRRPHVGVAVIVIKGGKILLGKRIGAHSSGSWNFPGGKLDFGEEIFTCAAREVMEEAGIKIKNLRLGPYTNDYFRSEELHYVTLFVIADYASGIAKVMEPEKCLGWQWVEWSAIPKPWFLPIQNLMKKGFNPLNT
jgi:8-oxo-dGTP diphosphatase